MAASYSSNGQSGSYSEGDPGEISTGKLDTRGDRACYTTLCIVLDALLRVSFKLRAYSPDDRRGLSKWAVIVLGSSAASGCTFSKGAESLLDTARCNRLRADL